MWTVSLDVHAGASQMVVVSEAGEVVMERKVATTAEALAEAVRAVSDPKRVVFEEGPLSGLIHDALASLAAEVISADPTRNALIALDERSDDARDARHLAELAQLGRVRPVFVPPEPYRSLRGAQVYARRLGEEIGAVKNRIKGLCRRGGVRYHGRSPYRPAHRADLIARLPEPARWQMASLCRRLDALRDEHRGAWRELRRLAARLPVVRRLQQIPGVGPVTAITLVAWLVAPTRFRSPSALVAYAGLGLGQRVTNWKPLGRTRASRRGNREIKRVLFLAARAAGCSESALGRRHRARQAHGWDISKTRRDIARTILKAAAALWRNGTKYDDDKISVPDA